VTTADKQTPVVEVDADDLPVYCPNPAMPLWSSHPKVYLEIEATGIAMCPYCGTRYALKGEPARAGRH